MRHESVFRSNVRVTMSFRQQHHPESFNPSILDKKLLRLLVLMIGNKRKAEQTSKFPLRHSTGILSTLPFPVLCISKAIFSKPLGCLRFTLLNASQKFHSLPWSLKLDSPPLRKKRFRGLGWLSDCLLVGLIEHGVFIISPFWRGEGPWGKGRFCTRTSVVEANSGVTRFVQRLT